MEQNIIYNCDCIEGFKKYIPDNSIDLIFTSPPYNCNIPYDNWNDYMESEDYFTWCEKWLTESYRSLKDDGRIAVNIFYEVNMKEKGGRIFIASEMWQRMKKVGFNFFGIVRLSELVPHKTKLTAWGSYMSPSSPYICCSEECVILGYKKLPKKQVQGETDLTKDEFIDGTTAIWKYMAETDGLTEANFSLDLPNTGIKMLTFKDEIVLDPFTGSGTTQVACVKLERKYLGFELSPVYFKEAYNRIETAKAEKSINLTPMLEFV